MFLVSEIQEESIHVCTGFFVAARRLVIVVSCHHSFQFALQRCRTTSSRTRSVSDEYRHGDEVHGPRWGLAYKQRFERESDEILANLRMQENQRPVRT